MNTLLVLITLVSLMGAVAAATRAWRAERAARRHAAARVAALRAAAGVPDPPPAGAGLDAFAPAARPAAVPAPDRGDTSGDDASTATMPPPLLAAGVPPVSSGHPQRALAVAAVALAALLGGIAYARVSRPAGAVGAGGTAGAPMELLSLRHEREGARLSIVGLVRNPTGGSVLEGVTVVALLFDQQGGFLLSTSAPLEFPRLAAGEESPFLLKVSAPEAVARYRVSFRGPGGSLPHVDRRVAPGAAAAGSR